jgi:hypothetical protein
MQDANRAIRSRKPGLIVTDGFETGALLNVCLAATGASGCVALELIGHAEPDGSHPLRMGEARATRLMKPFSLPDLAKAVRRALDTSQQ